MIVLENGVLQNEPNCCDAVSGLPCLRGRALFALLPKKIVRLVDFRWASFDVTVEPGIPATGRQAPKR